MLAIALLTLSADAASPDQVFAALQSTAGWSGSTTNKGVTVAQKDIPGLSVPAFRGTRTVDVTCDAYFAAVSDPGRHTAVNSMLRESGVISQSGDAVVFYQVVDLPLISDRYWINKAVNERNLGGVSGHHRQTWYAMNKDDYPTVRDAVEDKFGAVFTAINYGMWDLMPASESSCTITYAGISDPGGSVPGGAASWASEKSLPDNINSFYSAAR
jgi:hypothetical protein